MSRADGAGMGGGPLVRDSEQLASHSYMIQHDAKPGTFVEVVKCHYGGQKKSYCAPDISNIMAELLTLWPACHAIIVPLTLGFVAWFLLYTGKL